MLLIPIPVASIVEFEDLVKKCNEYQAKLRENEKQNQTNRKESTGT
jgi:hypothetical protein